MKKLQRPLPLLLWLFISTCIFATQQKNYSYETVPNDPMKARIYTLDNGLKVYMTVNTETPRIQTYIAVRVGGKNDPAENTGLAHYFEHLMFKGTERFGTQNYAMEKDILEQIEDKFEVYRQTTDEAERKAIYAVIDSLSNVASGYAIPNEYDKLMTAIGARGTNAYTGFDMTVYVEDIPSNEIDNWAKIQSDRFANNVIRGFHTELETVYEEKNMSLTSDGRKVYEAMYAALFPHHPYGTQTILGTQEHLKNPSIKTIKQYYRTWYVPNNMAVCVSGDFDPEMMIETIDKYFGNFKPNPNLPKLPATQERPITAPIVKEVLGQDAEVLSIGWRFPWGRSNHEMQKLTLMARILYNGKTGLLDVDLNQKQKIRNAYAGGSGMADYAMLIMQARPKEGQTLDDVRDLLLGEVEKLKAGEFDEETIQATINNFKLGEQSQLEHNNARANMFVNAFINDINWEDEVNSLDRMSKLTKDDIVKFANQYLGDNYAVIYKKQGQDPNEKKIEKPAITPIQMNRDATSALLLEIQNNPGKPIEPVFVDFNTDMEILKAKSDIEVLYKRNQTNDIFQLMYVFDMGSYHDKALGTAFQYMSYLGTPDMTVEEINAEFYKLACSFQVSPGSERTYITLSGLNENMPQAMELLEKLMANAQVNKEKYANLVDDILKSRSDAKLNQGQNFGRLMNYVIYGSDSPAKNMLSADELKNMDPQLFVDKIRNQNSYKHYMMYYGPRDEQELLLLIAIHHKVPEKLKDLPAGKEFIPENTTGDPIFYLAPYDAKQIYMGQFSTNGEKFDPEIETVRNLYNEYFGSGMSSIVFQEMREARGLAYSAWAGINRPQMLKYPYQLSAQIATQNDKMIEAIETFSEILNNMPKSETSFNLAKESIITRIRTNRTIKSNVLWAYVSAKDLGLSEDTNIRLFKEVQNMTLPDVVSFQEKWIEGRTYRYGILGDEKELDVNALQSRGQLIRLTKEDIFGY